MSFVDLMASDVWSDADITRRTEAMIRSEFPAESEMILNRKVLGASVGSYTLTEAEQAEVARYAIIAGEAQAAGVAARADMALLAQVFPLEAAQRRLDRLSLTAASERLEQPEVTPILDEQTGDVTNAEAVAQDQAERAAASAVVEPHLVTDQEGVARLDPTAVATDEAERAAAQGVIEAAPPDVFALFVRRKTTP